ncbi:MAG TPA: DNA polymerase III subunit gamma/tau, partial [Acidimicrobiales bacterium]|nr:DNA polymerase III subunit gamma/tau [Acidimicrobiales bacterium]
VRALRNAVREDRVGHAYLFSGPRGTGKTTTARILAKVLNCTNPSDGEPCGVCESCKAIEGGSSMDVHELDAASNNGVDAIRDLIAKAALGTPGRTKVYILDEVHMLSPAASNALLKTLEEPPGHVVFILATTDPQKVLPTIKSRTQHFEFSLLGADELAEHLRYVVDDAGLEVEPEALEQVLHEGAGSARDALSALDRVVAGGGTAETSEPVDELVEALCERDTGAALVGLAAEIRRGRDPRIVGEALLARLRDAFLAAMGTGLDHLPDTQREAVRGYADRLGPAAITRALEALGEALVEMRQAADARIPLEVALVRLTRAESDLSPAALLERIERLERRAPSSAPGPAPDPPAPAPAPSGDSPANAGRAALARAGAPTADTAADQRPALGPRRRQQPDPEPAAPAEPEPASAEEPPRRRASDALPDRDELTLAWGDELLDRLPPRAKARFKGGRFSGVEDGKAIFALPNEIHRDRCADFGPTPGSLPSWSIRSWTGPA